MRGAPAGAGRAGDGPGGVGHPLLLLVALAGVLPAALACTSIIVGGGATADGSVYMARTDDTGDARSTVNNLVYHDPRSSPAVFRSNANGLRMELPAPGLAYLALPVILADPAAGRNASGEEAGVNSAGVAISGTETIANSPAALAADPYTADGLIEDAIPSLLLPQATSAPHGAGVLGALIATHGAGEGFGVLLADAVEAWYLETASGHHWLAQRVPEGTAFVAANQGRLQEVDLRDTANFLASPGLEEFAAGLGLYDPGAGRPLNFSAAFAAEGPTDAHFNHPRVRALQAWLGRRSSSSSSGGGGGSSADADDQDLQAAAMPVFVQPTRQLGPADVMHGLRNHFDGSRHDAYLHRNPAEPLRPVAVLRSSMGHVTRLRAPSPHLPASLAAIHYVAMGMPALAPFIPIYGSLPGASLPLELTCAGSAPDPVSLFWKARRLQALVFQDWPMLAPGAVAAISGWEAEVESEQRPAMEIRYAAALARWDEAAAVAELVGFTARVVQQAGVLLQQLTDVATAQLGLHAMPPDDVLVRMLDAAVATYAFRLPLGSAAAGAAVDVT